MFSSNLFSYFVKNYVLRFLFLFLIVLPMCKISLIDLVSMCFLKIYLDQVSFKHGRADPSMSDLLAGSGPVRAAQTRPLARETRGRLGYTAVTP